MPGPTAHELLRRRYPRASEPVPLPPPAGVAPYRLGLESIVGADTAAAISRAGRLRFHAIGDTGGHGNPGPQQAVAAAMATELAGKHPARLHYHLGDVVYPHGEPAGYQAQFHESYRDYRAPIVGIPGNHDGECPPDQAGLPLSGFTAQFCASGQGLGPICGPGRGEPARPGAAHQPHVHWTLRHDLVTIIGLYTGVRDGGQLDPAQRDWLIGELRAARADAVLLLAMHHPVYSADVEHGSNLSLGDILDDCFAASGRAPDAVLSAHAHNYQRFSRSLNGRSVPYVVAGSGGFPELHRLGRGIPEPPAAFTGLPGLSLDAFQHRAFGFLTVTADYGWARLDYSLVVRRRPVAFDSVTVSSLSTTRALRGR
ncbi:MAG: metallophosphoesterase [Solirubrobacteraceae bacterium]